MNKFINIYADFLKKFLKPQKKLKVIFDCSNGTTGLVVRQLKIENLKLKIINGNPDGNFPAHGPDPLAKGVTSQLKKAVLKNKADLGVIFDGDGDRTRFVDDKGRDVNPDIIARLLIWETRPVKIIIDILTGWAVKELKKRDKGVQIISSKVGHQSISRSMKLNNADLGVEYSGHYYFKKFNYNDSGILTAIEIINAVSKIPFFLSQFVDLINPSLRETLAISQKQNQAVEDKFKKIKKFYQKVSNKISAIDGLTVGTKDFWFNVRLSNTEPVIRLNIEAKNKKILQKEKKRLLTIID